MIEIKIPLTEKQKQFLATVEKVPVTFYGGAKGGGKSHGLRNIMLLRRFQYAGSTGAIFRKTYPELEANHIRPIFAQFPQLRPYYNESKKILTLPNGSTLEFCYCESEADLDRYQGREFHDLGIEEAGQWIEVMFHRLRGSNRSAKTEIKARTLLTGNPGGVGHKWLKRLFIERDFKPNERPDDYAFVQALVSDNPALMENDPDYIHRLDSEPNEALRRAYKEGDWDIFAGQYFSEIRRNVHVVKPFPIPHHWIRFGAYDYGFNHPGAFGWFATDTDGNTYLYREYIKARQRVDQFAQHLNRFEDTKLLAYIDAGHDCWTKRNTITESSPPTIAEEFMKHEIILRKAKIDRIQGAAQLRRYLAWQNLASGRTLPRLFIFETCPISFETLTRVEHDPDNAEDVLKVDSIDGDPATGDDAYDMIRYGIMSRPPIADELTVRHPHGSPEWAAHETKRMEEAALTHFQQQEAIDKGEEYLLEGGF
jgi:phage terminase large subunit